MSYIERIIRAYAHMIRHTIDTLKKSPLILAVIPVASLLLFSLQMILTNVIKGGQASYLVLHAAEAAVISFVLSAYREAVVTKRLTLKKLHLPMFGHYFISVYFIQVISLWVVRILTGIPLEGLWIFHVAVFLILSPVPEVIYLEQSAGVRILEDIWEYLIRNWYVWLPIIVIFTAVLGSRYPQINMSHLRQNMMITEVFYSFKGASLYPLAPRNVVLKLIKNVVLSLYVLARGHLYNYTRLGNARKDANRYR